MEGVADYLRQCIAETDPHLTPGEIQIRTFEEELGQEYAKERRLATVVGLFTLLSVVIAFTCGTVVMYISRLIFSFRYTAMFRRFGAFWCGASFTAILYFALFKGLKSSGLIPTHITEYVGEHVLLTLFAFWVVAAAVLWIFQRMRLNIMRITILSGTFALALAFAGNDLVNFIGVPVAGFDAYSPARPAANRS